MNPVNATTLYVSASRAVLECDPRKPNTFADVYKLLPFFRQSLACLVCGKMLQDPIAPTNSECQHYVCLGCKGQKMQMKPSCSWCKDYAFFEENKQLSLLVECYRSLCLYIIHSPLLQPISSQAGGSPEVMALLDEVLISSQAEAETEPEELLLSDEVNSSAPESLTPTEAPPVPAELSSDPQSSFSNPPCSNGSQEYNGAELEDLPPSSPELEVCEVVEEQSQGDLSVSSASCGGLELSLPSAALDPTDSAVCSFRDGDSSGTELEEGEVLLLSVEEVLQTLDPIQPGRGSPHAQTHAQMCAQLDATHNYTQADRSRTGQGAHAAPVPPEAPTALRPPPARASRKRSHSESDRERVQPLPISCILQGSPSRTDGVAAVHAAPAPPPVAPHAYPPSLSNGVAPKAGRPIPHSHAKGSRKHMEQMAKKPHSKGRSGAASKCKERSKDQRLLAGSLVPPSPAKPPYRKPVEKKGCKCGRATQNPSVLTCRGQRCPCYSNRKACLDCICRGCQNSYMANGEKKLEAFAVPEKALEQTRLTLGINLTSITAAAALRNPPTTSIRSNTLLNVSTATGSPVATAYLSASPPQEPTFEDSLELLIG